MKIRLLQFLSIPVLTLAVLSCDGKGNGNSDLQAEPVILSITTDYDGKAMAGRPVTLHGSHFSPVASDNKVVCVIDDDPSKQNRYIEGILVAGGRDDILACVQ